MKLDKAQIKEKAIEAISQIEGVNKEIKKKIFKILKN